MNVCIGGNRSGPHLLVGVCARLIACACVCVGLFVCLFDWLIVCVCLCTGQGAPRKYDMLLHRFVTVMKETERICVWGLGHRCASCRLFTTAGIWLVFMAALYAYLFVWVCMCPRDSIWAEGYPMATKGSGCVCVFLCVRMRVRVCVCVRVRVFVCATEI